MFVAGGLLCGSLGALLDRGLLRRIACCGGLVRGSGVGLGFSGVGFGRGALALRGAIRLGGVGGRIRGRVLGPGGCPGLVRGGDGREATRGSGDDG